MSARDAILAAVRRNLPRPAVLLPEIPTSHTPYLAVQAGKEGLVRLLDRQNLSGQHGPGHVGGELGVQRRELHVRARSGAGVGRERR